VAADAHPLRGGFPPNPSHGQGATVWRREADALVLCVLAVEMAIYDVDIGAIRREEKYPGNTRRDLLQGGEQQTRLVCQVQGAR
jgi:hypothetical protein